MKGAAARSLLLSRSFMSTPESEKPTGDVAEKVEAADIELGKKMAEQRHDPAVKAAAKGGALGDQEPLYALSAGLALLSIVLWSPRLCRAAVSMGMAIGGADLVKRRLKKMFRRTRPNVLLEEGRYEAAPGGSGQKPEQSFPSGHTACTVAAARAFSRCYPKAGPAAAVATLGIGVSRVVSGKHWPLDVLAGAVVGFVVELFTSRILRALLPGRGK